MKIKVKMNPKEIKAEMVLRGVSAASIAESIGVSKSAVHHVIHGNGTSYRIASEVASAIGKSVNQVFGDRYLKRQTKEKQRKNGTGMPTLEGRVVELERLVEILMSINKSILNPELIANLSMGAKNEQH